MPNSPKFFTVISAEGIPEIVLGTADFVSRPIILLAQQEIIDYIDESRPEKLVINFKNVHHISSEFISSLIKIRDHVGANDGSMKFSHMNENVYAAFRITNLADRVFKIYDTTTEAIDAF